MTRRALLWSLPLLAGCAIAPEASPDASRHDEVSAGSAAPRAYRFVLQARSSEDPFDGAGSFGLPPGSALKNQSPSVNAQRDVTVSFRGFDNHQHVWKNGRIVFDVADPKGVIAGTSVNASGDVAFDVMGAAAGNGVWMYGAAADQTSFYSAEPLGADGWVDVTLLDDGRVGCRPSAGPRRFIGFPDPDGFRKVAVEAGTNPSSPYAYLFSPAFDRSGDVAAKVLLASGGNEVRFFHAGAPARVVVQDRLANPASDIETIDNGVALNDRGEIALVARISGRRAVLRTDGTTTVRIATEGQAGVAQVGWFQPVIDGSGRVVFKGEDTSGRNTIWVGDGATLDPIVLAGDALPSDRGEVLALPETDYDPENRIVFGGGLAINAQGDVVFSAALAEREGGGRLGTGIYLATRTR